MLSIENGTFNIKTNASGYDISAKALKASREIFIEDGNFTLSASDDGINCNNSITIENGNFLISSNDDAIHADEVVTINGGNFSISQSYEGIEGKVITLNSGTIHIVSSDDGLNASDGSGGDMQGGPGSVSSGVFLNINGGYIVLNAQGDAFDCNGTATMTGGDIIIHGPTENNNGAIDYDGDFYVSGGTIIAAGSSGMAQAPGTSSSQYSVIFNFNSSLIANTLVNIQTEDGENIITFAPYKRFASVVLSCPQLTYGETYNIYYGGSSTGVLVDGVYKNGEYSGGTLFQSFTISSIVTKINVQSGGPGGPGNH
jgi:hypothetical protein